MKKEYQYISADSHVEGAARGQWSHRVPKEYRDLVPPPPTSRGAGMGSYSGLVPEEFDPVLQTCGDKLAGLGSAEERVRELDRDGVDAEILYSLNILNVQDKNAYKVLFRGYNDWLAEEYCAAAPDRLLGLGLIPQTNLEDALAEMEHCAKLGLKGVQLFSYPSGQDYPTAEDDSFWATAIDMNMPLTIHVAINWGSPFIWFSRRSGDPLFKYPLEPEGGINSTNDF